MVHHGLGDVISALPAIHAADRVIGPSGCLEIIVKSQVEASLFEAIEWQASTRVHLLSAGSKWQRMLRMLSVAWRLRRTRLDIFVTPHMTSVKLARLLGILVGARRTVLPGEENGCASAITPRHGEHKAELYARYLVASGLPIDRHALRFPNLREVALQVERSTRRIVLAPAVGTRIEQHKAWPEAAFATLAERLLESWPDATIELFAAPPEREVLARVLAKISQKQRASVIISTPASPAQAAQSLMGAACVVTACSGASHLAALAEVPIVGLYGPTNPGYTGPFSRRLYPVRLGWACSPCYRPDFVRGCGEPGCMTEISVNMVYEAVAAALAGSPTQSCRSLRTTKAVAPFRMTP
jgi:ADP-heptose:LPS heptosyltransferase